MGRHGPVDRAAFEHDRAAPHPAGDGYQAEPDAGDEPGAAGDEPGIDQAVLVVWQLAGLGEGHGVEV